MKYFFAFIVGFALLTPPHVGGGHPIARQDVPVEVVSRPFTVNVQDDCEIGELVRMVVDGDVEGITWKVKPETPDFEVIEGGRRALFSSRTGGDYLIIVAAARDGEPFLFFQTLTVKGGEPPAPVSELTRKVQTWLKRLPANTDKAKIVAVAGVFRELADGATPIDKMLEATALANSAVIGDDLENWMPFLEGLGDELDVMVEAKQLETREQYRAAWLEISAAIEKGGR